jgi:hypothetical protein
MTDEFANSLPVVVIVFIPFTFLSRIFQKYSKLPFDDHSQNSQHDECS